MGGVKGVTSSLTVSSATVDNKRIHAVQYTQYNTVYTYIVMICLCFCQR